MQLYILCTDNYPNNGACALIIRNLLSNMKSGSFDAINVVTPAYNLQSEMKVDANGVSIHRLRCNGFLPNSSLKNVKNPFLLCRIKVAKLFHRILLKLCFPFDLYIQHAYSRFLNKLAFQEGDIIVSFLGHYEPSRALLKFKNRAAKKVLYQVDPCSQRMTLKGRARRAASSLEKRLYSNFDGFVFFPTIFREIRGHLYNKNVCLIDIPNIRPIKDYGNEVFAKYGLSEGVIKLVFSGRLYKGIRDAAYTLHLLSRVRERLPIVFFMVGVDYSEIPESFRKCDFVFCVGLHSFDIVNQYLLHSDYLINIGNNITNQLPSKLFDYLSFGKPIINFCKDQSCVTLPYLERYELSLNVFEGLNEDAQINQVCDFIKNKRGLNVDYETVSKVFFDCTSDYCSEQFFRFLNLVNSTN